MDASSDISTHSSAAVRVMAGEDRFGREWGLGISTLTFKVSGQESSGLLVIENAFCDKGGPPRHLHYDQDEWFYVLEGEFLFEVGQEQMRLSMRDALLAPRKVPHVWASVGEAGGRILIAFNPAGKMEAFFRQVAGANAMPPQDPALWREHGME
jgi:mannose-6-phosphate isomerase-like protein (cupin superfamily)